MRRKVDIMKGISYKLDMWRHVLYNAVDSNKELNTGNILKLSQELDKVIVEAYKEQLNTNNE
jgi:hypothetical protein